jgi:hypothetical protein
VLGQALDNIIVYYVEKGPRKRKYLAKEVKETSLHSKKERQRRWILGPDEGRIGSKTLVLEHYNMCLTSEYSCQLAFCIVMSFIS